MIKITIDGDKLRIESDNPRFLLIVSIADAKAWLNDRTKVIKAGIISAIGSGIVWVFSQQPWTIPPQPYSPALPPAPTQVTIDNNRSG